MTFNIKGIFFSIFLTECGTLKVRIGPIDGFEMGLSQNHYEDHPHIGTFVLLPLRKKTLRHCYSYKALTWQCCMRKQETLTNQKHLNYRAKVGHFILSARRPIKHYVFNP